MKFETGLGTLALLVSIAAVAADEKLLIGRFSAGDLQDWQTKSFMGETHYTFDNQSGQPALFADSRGTASGLYREIRVDLQRTPWLNWSWRVNKVLSGLDERTKAGDDYPARVYVVVSGGAAFWKTRSLVYVWSSSQPAGATWNNAFTSNARVMALRSGTKDAGRWASEKRDIRADFRQLFGEAIDAIDAVALMTDTDNSGQSATAWYGDIYFTAR
ncbi:MAG: DUF3047 domain-containing protein [Candidatus Competibacteraceae bacterium]|nr:DUF3047 domain-containing protein [Candidatus Competibacteraceae bacterium]MBK7984003.1 DUF3047 domain-containing protein [Candidatus Competibacteraceae bacterium]MBK8897455.1 DUF3047 domain-containing protein [Candidatus Competibacteraceae bacterium]MBK8963607.1 DUF3047 domain-containing protein [Candidatus Competibacteraceae bacterium]MBK9950498.1 DUF3047 domain-containing protein [Candidatus Competibacteraceae bacterium]